MDIDELWEVVCKGVRGRCGEETSLPHASAEEFPESASLLNELFGTDEA